jgi:hypothetical protein
MRERLYLLGKSLMNLRHGKLFADMDSAADPAALREPRFRTRPFSDRFVPWCH